MAFIQSIIQSALDRVSQFMELDSNTRAAMVPIEEKGKQNLIETID